MQEAEQISSADATQAPASTFSIFGRTLILPLVHPVFLVACSLLPCPLLMALSHIYPGWTVIGGDNTDGGVMILYPLSIASQRAPLPFAIWLLSFVVLALWLCTWQRAVVLRFTEPPVRLLRRSLGRTPAYAAALLCWLVATLATYTLPLAMLGYGRAALGLAEERTDLDPVIMTLWQLAMILPALWVMARLAPLPALVAARGWSGAVFQSWRLSRGRGFGLTVAMLACFGIGIFIGMFTAGSLTDAAPAAPWLQMVIGFANLGITALTLMWFTALGGLIAAPALADDIESSVFD